MFDIENSSYGKLILAEMIDVWGHAPCRQYQDGSWQIGIWLDDWEVENSDLLIPIFKSPMRYCEEADGTGYRINRNMDCFANDANYGIKYTMEWHVDLDGTVQPDNGNALRLEAHLLAESASSVYTQ